MSDPSALAAHARAIAKVGVAVVLKRVTGVAPNAKVFSASVRAVVRNYVPDTGSPERAGYASTQMGGITQGARQVIVLKRDLANAGFPLPVEKNDKILISATGDQLNVLHVDATKRDMAGTIELMATGVA